MDTKQMKFEDVKVTVAVEYIYILLPFVKYKAVGHVGVLTVFGFSVYRKVGYVKDLCGFTWGKNK